MKAKVNKKVSSKVKRNPINEQIKQCFREHKLAIQDEQFDGIEFSFHSLIEVTDVRSVIHARYATDFGKIMLHALHIEVSEHEWFSVMHFLNAIKEKLQVTEECLAPKDMAIGCMTTLEVEAVGIQFEHFIRVMDEIVSINRIISIFLCGQRDRRDGTLERKLILDMSQQ